MLLPPIASVLPELLAALRPGGQVLLNAPTGAGKSTWLPLQLLQSPDIEGRIILLEPRRLAARNIAQRLAECLDEVPGGQVGYCMRAERCVGEATRLEVVTEGVLTRMLQDDPMLTGVSLVILDEFHERSVQADLALALLLDVRQGLREDLTLLVMSATLDNRGLEKALPDAVTVSAEGRAFAVERRFVSPPGGQEMMQGIAAICARLLRDEAGSMLVFLPGVREIQRLQRALASRLAEDVSLCPLYGGLSLEAQRKAIAPPAAGKRKVVLATNIAQTSLTIEGIRLVVDCALERVARFDPRTGLTRLTLQRISQAAMTQRAGRAGRLAAGLCVHLVDGEQAQRAPAYSEPQILLAEASGLLLDVAQWGCPIEALGFLDLPPKAHLAAGRALLARLDALLPAGGLSAIGQRMAQMGVDPRLARMLVEAKSADEKVTAAYLAAILEDPPYQGQCDLGYLLTGDVRRWQARARQLAGRLKASGGQRDPALIAPLLALAFADRIALRRGNESRYQLANGTGAALADDDPLHRHQWLIAPSLLQTDNQPQARILLAQGVEIEALLSRYPQLLQVHDRLAWSEGGSLQARRRWQIGELLVKSQLLAQPNEQQVQQALLDLIRQQGLGVLQWSEAAAQLRLRIQCAARYLPEYRWPQVDDAALLDGLDDWLAPHLSGVRSQAALKQIDVAQALAGLLDWPLRQRLDSELPTHYCTPAGSRLAICYHGENPPTLAVPLAQMYGQAQTPHIAGGRVSLTLALLSPAGRPLQITSDLRAFWQGAYREVQKEMKGRYPKHLWPDDPANTAPTRHVRRRGDKKG